MRLSRVCDLFFDTAASHITCTAARASGLRLVNAKQPLSLLPSLAWQPATAGTDTSWRIVRTASIASDATTLTLLSERLLPGGYLLALSGAAAPTPMYWVAKSCEIMVVVTKQAPP